MGEWDEGWRGRWFTWNDLTAQLTFTSTSTLIWLADVMCCMGRSRICKKGGRDPKGGAGS